MIDLRALDCSVIRLSSGQIEIPQQSLRIVGRGRTALTIDGGHRSRIFHHTGFEVLRIEGLSMANGTDSRQFASGGCLYSTASTVELRGVVVHHCIASGIKPPGDLGPGIGFSAYGGAIHAGNNQASLLTLRYSTVASSSADAFDSMGGGILATGHLSLFHSRVRGNVASVGSGAAAYRLTANASLIDHNGFGADGDTYGDAGGAFVEADVNLYATTVADNRAQSCAGLCAGGSGLVSNSTISRNTAYNTLSGAQFGGEARILNSTIATNREGPGQERTAARCRGAIQAGTLYLKSTIAALNDCGTSLHLDIGSLTAGGAVTGFRNLVRYSRAPLPADTLRVNPRIASLTDNGGPTPTHRLLRGSAAIDRGSSAPDLLYDQRGQGYPRVKGVRADIGSYER